MSLLLLEKKKLLRWEQPLCFYCRPQLNCCFIYKSIIYKSINARQQWRANFLPFSELPSPDGLARWKGVKRIFRLKISPKGPKIAGWITGHKNCVGKITRFCVNVRFISSLSREPSFQKRRFLWTEPPCILL